VPQSKYSSAITLNFNPPALRWLLLFPALLAILGATFAGRWYVGSTVAEYASTPDPDGIEMARLATRWAPDNAAAHWRLGALEEKNFSADNLNAAVREYQLAVELEPYDFRYWMELGRALEAAGDSQNAEKALRRAVELAPAYSHPHWQYGNVLLRQGRIDEAFAELARAADADSTMQPAVFGLASQVFGDDQAQIDKALPSASLRLQFALSLIRAGKPDKAIGVVQAMSAADRKSQSETMNEVGKAFIASHYYHAALLLLRETQTDAQELPAAEQFWNGGFETPVINNDEKPFHWLIDAHSQAQITIDNARPHSGQNSLRIFFKSPNKLEAIPLSQTVIIEPDTTYRLQFYVRTEGLTTASSPLLGVKDLAGQSLASSPPLPSGTNDWQAVTMTFKTKSKEEAILITLYREQCGNKDPVCPIFGTVWYDDFNLQRIGGAATATTRTPGKRQ
jgi:tetratricopeptide (TPR) repeat protein